MTDANKSEEAGNATSLGAVRITNEVVAVMAGLAAVEIDGIAGMSGGIAGGIAEMLGRSNLSRGVKVEVGEHEATIDLFIIVEYGVSIPVLSLNAQEKVKQAVESMTGLAVTEVNVYVQGVSFAEGPAEEPEEQSVN